MTPSCPGCRTPMVAARYFIPVAPDPFFFSDPPPPFPVWLCPSCGMRIDREEGEP